MPAKIISESENVAIPIVELHKSATPKGFKWHPVDKRDSVTVLEVAMLSPMQLMALIVMEDIEGPEALEQAEKVLDLLRYIRPPCKNPDDWEFIIRVGRNRDFKDFRIVKRGKSKCGPGEYRSKYLSIAPRDWYSGAGDRRVMKRFHEKYFGGKPTVHQMVRFVLREENFSSSPLPLLD